MTHYITSFPVVDYISNTPTSKYCTANTWSIVNDNTKKLKKIMVTIVQVVVKMLTNMRTFIYIFFRFTFIVLSK